MDSNEHISIDECLDGHLYFIRARNSNIGIWRAKDKVFEIRRKKFTAIFIDQELHWDCGPPHGTAKPRKMIEEAPEFADTNAGAHSKMKYFEEWEKAESTVIEATGAVFLDLDGTVLDWMTGKPVANAIETIQSWRRKGVQIIITTRRGHAWPSGSPYSPEVTEALLERIGLEYDQIVYDIHSPRMVINDEGAEAIHHPASGGWDYPDFPFDSDKVIYHDRELPKYGLSATITKGIRRSFYFHTQEPLDVLSSMRLMGHEPVDYETKWFSVETDDVCGNRYLSLMSDASYNVALEFDKKRAAKGSCQK